MKRKTVINRLNNIEKAVELLTISEKRPLTEEELNIIKLHSGSGGIYTWKNGQFFTPAIICDFISDILEPKDNSSILEFSCGNGVFINSLLNKNKSLNITGIEIDPDLAKICKLCYPETNIICDDALTHIKECENKYDYVIGNPPFGLKINHIEGFTKAKSKSEEYFVEMAVRALKDGGEAILIVPDGILANACYRSLREWMLGECYYLSTISLPPETFYFSGTSVKTSIMHFKKKYKNYDAGDYNIFMALCEKIGWDKRGNKTECDLEAIKHEYLKYKNMNSLVFNIMKKSA